MKDGDPDEVAFENILPVTEAVATTTLFCETKDELEGTKPPASSCRISW
jgi:hypothetical protein